MSVSSYIQNQPAKARVLMQTLRNRIVESMPYCDEKVTYDIPFFYYKRRMCYLYLSKKKKDVVLLGFCQGAQLSNEQGLLVGNGKVIRVIEFDLNQTQDLDLVQEVINEAVILQDHIYNRK